MSTKKQDRIKKGQQSQFNEDNGLVQEKNFMIGDDKYTGTMKEGKPEGQGLMKYANGNIYEGEWKDGKKYGHGTKTN
tara:strand:+ start:62 stop:292 length:231 start_codon:yes stop_codon:yes gene_type:complete